MLSEESVILEASDLVQGYRNRIVLDQVNLRFTPGVTAILGRNGAGKTTLLKTLSTEMLPKQGELRINGTRIRGSSALREARRSIGYLPQGFVADPTFSVADLVRYAAWLREAPTDIGTIEAALEFVDLTELSSRKIRSLSGGMKQRAAIAATIVGSPKLLIFDEPTVGLDPEQRIYFRRLLDSLRDLTIILSTHLIEDVVTVGDRIVVLSDGRVCFQGSVNELAALSILTDDASTMEHAESGFLSVIERVQE
ncbi:ABC transporter ATP-binding protein [Bowdeniella massiliensis]|uniref:ABC transporter ATP-binding protein n=1 Tax=Bowdeniella massiliensis TaxID=2932264 RepID=UPI0020282490|nr:ATP-binding cassette domain-containing protein [Bowdeniella massiliensis]